MASRRPVSGELAKVLNGADPRAAYERMLAELAAALPKAPPYSAAAIVAQMQKVRASLDGLPAAKKVTKADELAARRNARRAKAAEPSPAIGEGGN